MKKFFNYLGLIVLLCFSFVYTEKTANVVKEVDDIMIEIKAHASELRVLPAQAIIENGSIIPGINGREIDINKSYQEMRMIGSYNESYLQYKNIVVDEQLKNNKDKYIVSGNREKKMVSLIFLVETKTNVDNILEILDIQEATANFFLDGNWLENNSDKAYEIVNKGHTLGNLGYDYDYQNSSFAWADRVIKKVSKQKEGYCIKTDDKDAKICALNNDYTLEPIMITSNPMLNTKNSISNGSLLAYKVNASLERELELIIKYIRSKGYEIVGLKEMLEE